MRLEGRQIALTGVPRSGTTLCCRLLGEAPDTVALFEPMEVRELAGADHEAALAAVAEFFRHTRRRLLDTGRARTQQVGGAVPDNPFASRRGSDGKRVREAVLGDIAVDKPLSAKFTLVVKHNAAFTALLPGLASRFETWAVIRNPLAVLASWQSVDLPVSAGRLPAGERLDAALLGRLAAQPVCEERQLMILEWFYSRYRDGLPGERVIRYETVVASAGEALAAATGVSVPVTPLHGRNRNRLYDRSWCQASAERLLARAGAWRHFYADADVEALAMQLSDPVS